MTVTDAVYPVQLGFTPESHVIDDPDHPGLFQAAPVVGPYDGEGLEFHDCPAIDLAAQGAVQPELAACGFDTVDLSGWLRSRRPAPRCAGRAMSTTTRRRRSGQHSTAPCCRPRAASPCGCCSSRTRASSCARSVPTGCRWWALGSGGINDHGGAATVHADQDVYGTPLTQLMDGGPPSCSCTTHPTGTTTTPRCCW